MVRPYQILYTDFWFTEFLPSYQNDSKAQIRKVVRYSRHPSNALECTLFKILRGYSNLWSRRSLIRRGHLSHLHRLYCQIWNLRQEFNWSNPSSHLQWRLSFETLAMWSFLWMQTFEKVLLVQSENSEKAEILGRDAKKMAAWKLLFQRFSLIFLLHLRATRQSYTSLTGLTYWLLLSTELWVSGA